MPPGVPYTWFDGEDTHWLRIGSNFRDFTGPVPDTGSGNGYQLEAVMFLSGHRRAEPRRRRPHLVHEERHHHPFRRPHRRRRCRAAAFRLEDPPLRCVRPGELPVRFSGVWPVGPSRSVVVLSQHARPEAPAQADRRARHHELAAAAIVEWCADSSVTAPRARPRLRRRRNYNASPAGCREDGTRNWRGIPPISGAFTRSAGTGVSPNVSNLSISAPVVLPISTTVLAMSAVGRLMYAIRGSCE